MENRYFNELKHDTAKAIYWYKKTNDYGIDISELSVPLIEKWLSNYEDARIELEYFENECESYEGLSDDPEIIEIMDNIKDIMNYLKEGI